MRFAQLGNAVDPSQFRRLNVYEVNDFQLRHRDVLAKIHKFEELLRLMHYDQTRPNAAFQRLIPSWGFGVQDPRFGAVVVHPDASGILRYTVAPAAIAAEINKPTYRSPTGNFMEDWLAGVDERLDELDDILTAAAWIVGIGGAFFVLAQGKQLFAGR